jgi:hypothetical protein
LEEKETVDDLLATLSEVVGNYTVPLGREQISADEPIQKQVVVPEAPAPLPAWLTAIPKRQRFSTDQPLKTAAQARALIIEGLRQIHGFPGEGVSVTVYGFQPWSAMLTFAPNSTTLANATRYRKILAEIVYDLRKNFEIDIDPDSDEHAAGDRRQS